jgi:hypothetical protein
MLKSFVRSPSIREPKQFVKEFTQMQGSGMSETGALFVRVENG